MTRPNKVTERSKAIQALARIRPNKYNFKKVKTEDGTFDSQAEYRRWGQLQLMERGGLIEGLQRQMSYALDINGQNVCKYKADFVYYFPAGPLGRLTIEDVKGVRTPVYRLKKKLMKAIHGIEIQEVAA